MTLRDQSNIEPMSVDRQAATEAARLRERMAFWVAQVADEGTRKRMWDNDELVETEGGALHNLKQAWDALDAGVRWAATRDEDDPVETIRADQIKVGDSLYIQDEDEWHTASQVVIRDEDVLLWLAGEDHDTDPWDVFPLDAVFNRMAAAPVSSGEAWKEWKAEREHCREKFTDPRDWCAACRVAAAPVSLPEQEGGDLRAPVAQSPGATPSGRGGVDSVEGAPVFQAGGHGAGSQPAGKPSGALRSPSPPVSLPDEKGAEDLCEHSGHDWLDAGGGMEICGACGEERWAETEDANERTER